MVALTTRQETTYQGKDRWRWAVWIDGPAAELDAVKCVTWHLHPTFPDPERTTTDRASLFRVESAGWGEFTLRAVVENKDGKRSELSHELVLEVPNTEERAPTRGIPDVAPRVFISHSANDTRLVSALQKALRGRGIDVLDPDEILPLESMESSVHDQLRAADTVVAVMSPEGARAVQHDVDSAFRQKTPVIIIDVGENPLRLNPTVPRIPLSSEGNIPDVVESLIQQIHTSKRRKR